MKDVYILTDSLKRENYEFDSLDEAEIYAEENDVSEGYISILTRLGEGAVIEDISDGQFNYNVLWEFELEATSKPEVKQKHNRKEEK